jgi:hypothetical protein
MNSLFSIKNLNKEWYMSIQGSQRALTLDYIALSWEDMDERQTDLTILSEVWGKKGKLKISTKN